MDETWVEVGCTAANKAKTVPPAGKVMASGFFGGAKGTLLIDYLQIGVKTSQMNIL